MTGILGNEWTMPSFTPMGDIPSLGRLTVYMGESKNLSKGLLQEFVDDLENGNIKLNIDRGGQGKTQCAMRLAVVPLNEHLWDTGSTFN